MQENGVGLHFSWPFMMLTGALNILIFAQVVFLILLRKALVRNLLGNTTQTRVYINFLRIKFIKNGFFFKFKCPWSIIHALVYLKNSVIYLYNPFLPCDMFLQKITTSTVDLNRTNVCLIYFFVRNIKIIMQYRYVKEIKEHLTKNNVLRLQSWNFGQNPIL